MDSKVMTERHADDKGDSISTGSYLSSSACLCHDTVVDNY